MRICCWNWQIDKNENKNKNKIMTDWTGNKNSIYKTLGASNHTDK